MDEEPYYPFSNESSKTQKCLAYVPLSRAPTPKTMNPSITMRAPFANKENDTGVHYKWKAPDISRPPMPRAAPAPMGLGPPVAGLGPDPRRPRGRAVGYGNSRRMLTGQYPFDRDNIGLDRKEYFTSKDWDKNCGHIPSLPTPSSKDYKHSLEHNSSRQKCNIRCEAESYDPIPKGLERVYPRDVKNWPEIVPKPMVRLSSAHANHENTRINRQTVQLPSFGQTDTIYGGSMGTCRPRNIGATIDRLSRGDLHY